MRLQYNHDKLEKLNSEVHRGFATLRGLERSRNEAISELRQVEREIYNHHVSVVRRRAAERGQKLDDAGDVPADFIKLERRLERLTAKRGRFDAMLDAEKQNQDGRAALLENSVKLLRERGVEVELAVDSSTYSDIGPLLTGMPTHGAVITGPGGFRA